MREEGSIISILKELISRDIGLVKRYVHAVERERNLPRKNWMGWSIARKWAINI